MEVVDGKGRGVPNAEVRWTASAGSVSPAVAVTDASGHARASWVLGTAVGQQTAHATITTGTGPVNADFTVTATAGPAALLSLTPDTVILTVGATRQLTSAAIDTYGNAIPASGLQWATSDSAVAKVSSTGLVTLVSEGRATITVASGALRDSTRVTTYSTFPVAKFAFGEMHTCALSTSGQVYCWGQNPHGQLGAGAIAQSQYPIAVSGGRSYKDLSVRSQTTCAVATDGAAYCWGLGEAGQLGTGASSSSFVPAPVVGGLRFASVAVGQYHACGLTTDGKVYCWGNNYGGQLGVGNTIDHSLVPVQVSAPGLTFTALTAGYRYDCALASGGIAYCWGDNAHSQLGSGNLPLIRYVPTRVAGTLSFSSLSAGDAHVCGVAAGAAYCWGEDLYGQVGTGNDPPPVVSEPAPVALGLSFTAVAAGESNTCGLGPDGRAYCWGYRGLGVSSVVTAYAPTAVSGGLTFASIYAGGGSTCGITQESVAYCWGNAPQRFGYLLP
ncbi:MAG TPA: Ig-like domain-containing protein [Longimicrobiaceae bacterium]|nr:Ig-like domain-containing protein [Longimicrobiaceae bacterium]